MDFQNMNIVPIQLDEEGIKRYSRQLKNWFPETPLNSKRFEEASLVWQYIKNPEGCAIGFDAFDDGQLVAHYVCIPTIVMGSDGHLKALLSLNTATSPRYYGRGLFTKLALETFSVAKHLGYSCVFGVGNKNSTPGLVQKLGFNLVAPLEALIGIGQLQPQNSDSSLQFQRIWNKASLQWRCSNPANRIRALQNGNTSIYYADTDYPFISAYDARLEHNFSNQLCDSSKFKLKLVLGLFPQGAPTTFFKIPNFLKPSPLNFIFKSLDESIMTPDRQRVHFTFLDFDAY
jgi:hypothetical protein